MKRKYFLVILFLVLAIFLSGCGGKKEVDYSRVEPASEKQIKYISGGIKKETNAEIGEVYVVKSNDFDNVYFCATRLSGPGISNDCIGVWSISGDKNNPGMIFSVNGIAKQFSDYPDGSKTQANIKMSDDGADLAEKYILNKTSI